MPREINFDNDILYCIEKGIPFDTIESNFSISKYKILKLSKTDERYRKALIKRYENALIKK